MTNDNWDKKAKIDTGKTVAKIFDSNKIKSIIGDQRVARVENPEQALTVDYGSDWEEEIKFDSDVGVDRVFQLNALVKILKIPLMNNNKIYYQNRVYFIIQPSTDQIIFYNKFVPDNLVEGVEDEATIERLFMAIPLGKPFLGYISKGDKFIKERHIALMNNEMEKFFHGYQNKIIRIDCLTQAQFESMYNNC